MRTIIVPSVLGLALAATALVPAVAAPGKPNGVDRTLTATATTFITRRAPTVSLIWSASPPSWSRPTRR
ncbi:hypothetical protein AAEX63_01985 [Luteococcus sp. H138]|uniref:hypothetical protein n=1 Tax=unclassified Luteococcus TaxID=2639923 RepID=UPI00313F3D7D